jgi:hypothetical protein
MSEKREKPSRKEVIYNPEKIEDIVYLTKTRNQIFSTYNYYSLVIEISKSQIPLIARSQDINILSGAIHNLFYAYEAYFNSLKELNECLMTLVLPNLEEILHSGEKQILTDFSTETINIIKADSNREKITPMTVVLQILDIKTDLNSNSVKILKKKIEKIDQNFKDIYPMVVSSLAKFLHSNVRDE